MRTLFFISFLALGLAACSQDPEFFTTASGTLDKDTATSNKGSLETSAKFPTNGSPSGMPTFTRGDSEETASPYAGCTTKDPATTTDADSDGVKTQKTTWNCKDIDTDRAAKATRIGTMTVTDNDDSDANSGYKYSYAVDASYKNGTTHDITYSYNGFWEMVKAATTVVYSSKYKGTFAGTEHGEKQDSVSGGTFSYTITPTDMAHVYNAGTAEYSGFFAYNWSNKNYVFKTTGTGLKYDHSCGNFYTEGTVSYTDGSSNTVTLNWGDSACDAPTVKYNDTAI